VVFDLLAQTLPLQSSVEPSAQSTPATGREAQQPEPQIVSLAYP
jgi:hypothetical protein